MGHGLGHQTAHDGHLAHVATHPQTNPARRHNLFSRNGRFASSHIIEQNICPLRSQLPGNFQTDPFTCPGDDGRFPLKWGVVFYHHWLSTNFYTGQVLQGFDQGVVAFPAEALLLEGAVQVKHQAGTKQGHTELVGRFQHQS